MIWLRNILIDLKEKVLTDRMESGDLVIEIVISLQSALGILGNVSFLVYYLLVYYNKHTLKTVDLILTHVFTSNSLIILSTGLPQIMRAFEWKRFFNDVECKLILYIQRLGRSMSITSTCLLSVFQAITISPSVSYYKDFQIKFPKYVHLSISSLWILYVIVNMFFPMYTSTKSNSENKTKKTYFEFCPGFSHDKIVETMYTAFWVFPEVLFSILIVCSSISMIVILYGHKKRVQYILSTQASTRISPESRATQNILVLVCTFLAFNTISSILLGYITLYFNPNLWLRNITTIISMCFPSLSPFVTSHDSIISGFCFSFIRNIKRK
ncbi:vomeronasal type-1 receptor 4-like [Cricetulus griseus]|uniref:Vomeronasal type-1 receptor n=2 Tax=Cricetulus griseus TaxID=10029 RepID=A0A9J7FBK3_CRIGR|nr:vomeronasal type-1 receptor 4-like [Cricetulus griseus]XP_027254461.1 vomeronasal type-1 receptor 4-like [Cricetulus griseus]